MTAEDAHYYQSQTVSPVDPGAETRQMALLPPVEEPPLFSAIALAANLTRPLAEGLASSLENLTAEQVTTTDFNQTRAQDRALHADYEVVRSAMYDAVLAVGAEIKPIEASEEKLREDLLALESLRSILTEDLARLYQIIADRQAALPEAQAKALNASYQHAQAEMEIAAGLAIQSNSQSQMYEIISRGITIQEGLPELKQRQDLLARKYGILLFEKLQAEADATKSEVAVATAEKEHQNQIAQMMQVSELKHNSMTRYVTAVADYDSFTFGGYLRARLASGEITTSSARHTVAKMVSLVKEVKSMEALSSAETVTDHVPIDIAETTQFAPVGCVAADMVTQLLPALSVADTQYFPRMHSATFDQLHEQATTVLPAYSPESWPQPVPVSEDATTIFDTVTVTDEDTTTILDPNEMAHTAIEAGEPAQEEPEPRPRNPFEQALFGFLKDHAQLNIRQIGDGYTT